MKFFKKNFPYFLFLFLASFLIMFPSFLAPYICGHDTRFHVANISAILSQMNIFHPFVKEPLNFIAKGFGYGTRFFYPPIPHLTAAYITKIIAIFGNQNILLGMRITAWLTIFLSGIFCFLFIDKVFQNKKIALVISSSYMIAPYHLSEIFIRDAFSEMFFAIFPPLILLGLFYLLENNKKMFYLCFVSGYTLAIYSHMAMSIYFTFLLLITFFLIYFKKIFTKQNVWTLCKACILILLFTASFWVPLMENKLKGSYGVFTPYYMTGKGDMQFSTISILEPFLFWKSHTFNGIRFHLPLYIIILSIGSIYFIWKKKLWKEKYIVFILSFLFVSLIMITNVFPWYYVPDFFATLQFPWRLALFVSLGMICLASIILKEWEKKKYFSKLIFILLICVIISAFHNIYHLDEVAFDLEHIDYQKGLGNQAEYLPKNTLDHLDYYNKRTNEILIINGNGIIEETNENFPNISFTISANENLTVEFPRLYYFGYQLYLDKKEIPLTESEYGFLQASLTENGKYQLVYKGSFLMNFSFYLSICSFFTFLIFYLFLKKENIGKKNLKKVKFLVDK